MKKLFVLITLSVLSMPVACAAATSRDISSDDVPVSKKTAEELRQIFNTGTDPHPDMSHDLSGGAMFDYYQGGGIVSISTDSPNDLNWHGVMEVHNNGDSPAPVVVPLPLLDSYPIENFEIKLKLLDKKF